MSRVSKAPVCYHPPSLTPTLTAAMATSTAEESKEADDYMNSLLVGTEVACDVSRPIKRLWEAAEADLERGTAMRAKRGDNTAQAQAYVYLMRYVEWFVSIRGHPKFDAKSPEGRKGCKMAPAMLDILENMKRDLAANYTERTRKERAEEAKQAAAREATEAQAAAHARAMAAKEALI